MVFKNRFDFYMGNNATNNIRLPNKMIKKMSEESYWIIVEFSSVLIRQNLVTDNEMWDLFDDCMTYVCDNEEILTDSLMFITQALANRKEL